MNPIVVIPARMASARLPGKPLADIAGRPMIVHVLLRALSAGIGPVAVACAEPEIADAVRAAGGIAVLTDPALPSGSDRVHAALAALDPSGRHDVVLNLQGDFPLIEPGHLRAALRPLEYPAFDIGTLVTPILDEAEANAGVGRQGRLRLRGGPTLRPRALLLPRRDPVRRRAALAPHRRLRVAAARAGPLRRPAADPAGTARDARTVARAGGRHADRLRAGSTRRWPASTPRPTLFAPAGLSATTSARLEQ